MKDTATKLSLPTILLHWSVALGMIGMLAVGLYMKYGKDYSLYPLHKSIGVLLFALIMARVIWRIYNGWPAHAAPYKKWEINLSKIVHYALLIGTILIPVSGFIMSAMGGHGVSVFGFQLVAINYDPDLLAMGQKVKLPINAATAQIGATLHAWVSYIILFALFLHISGALKHHVVDKDSTLKRMLGKEI